MIKLSPPTSRLIRRFFIYALLLAVTVIVLFPLYYAVVISLVTDADVSKYPPTILPIGLHFENYSRALALAPPALSWSRS